MFAIRTKVAIALGNGNRKQNEQLATVQGCEPNELFDAAVNSIGCDLSKLPGTIVPAEGVTPTEIVTLLRNAQICDVVEVKPETDSEDLTDGESASVDNTETNKPAKRAKK